MWGCLIPIVMTIVAAGIAVIMFGKGMVDSEPPALCGSQVMEEGQECVRGSGDSAVRFGADEARQEQDSAKDFFGWIVILVGGGVSLGGVGILWLAIKYRKEPHPPA